MQITKHFEFEAAHQLKKAGFDYGKCENVHGHSYKLQVHIFGLPGEDGMIMNFSKLKKIVKENIIDIVDHSYLNDSMKTICDKIGHPYDGITTCENMSIVFAYLIARLVAGTHTNIEKIGITLYEQSDSSCYHECSVYHFANGN